MEKKINEAVCRYGMEEIYDGAIVGFSGGADSSALLHYLSTRCKSLLAVHINHMIRGEEAVGDREHCRLVCQKYGIDFISYDIDIPNLSRERKKGLEEVAREERYRVFYELLSKNPQYRCIVTAHNSNDNAETVVFNLTRGTGTRGLCGINPVQNKVLRTLILVSRAEILDYCQANNIEYVTDSTNECDDYTRNNIRHNILPRLEQINPSFLSACTRLGEILRQDEEYITKRAKEIIAQNKIVKEAPTSLLLSLEDALLSRVLMHMAGTSLDYKGVRACCELLKNGTAGKRVNLAQGISFKLEHNYAAFISNDELSSVEFYEELNTGINIIKSINTVIAINCEYNCEDFVKASSVRLDRGQIVGKMYVRSKRDGDTVKSGGMTKLLKRILTDKHIPLHKRGKLPVICDQNGILTVPGIVARDGAFNKKGDMTINIFIHK